MSDDALLERIRNLGRVAVDDLSEMVARLERERGALREQAGALRQVAYDLLEKWRDESLTNRKDAPLAIQRVSEEYTRVRAIIKRTETP